MDTDLNCFVYRHSRRGPLNGNRFSPESIVPPLKEEWRTRLRSKCRSLACNETVLVGSIGSKCSYVSLKLADGEIVWSVPDGLFHDGFGASFSLPPGSRWATSDADSFLQLRSLANGELKHHDYLRCKEFQGFTDSGLVFGGCHGTRILSLDDFLRPQEKDHEDTVSETFVSAGGLSVRASAMGGYESGFCEHAFTKSWDSTRGLPVGSSHLANSGGIVRNLQTDEIVFSSNHENARASDGNVLILGGGRSIHDEAPVAVIDVNTWEERWAVQEQDAVGRPLLSGLWASIDRSNGNLVWSAQGRFVSRSLETGAPLWESDPCNWVGWAAACGTVHWSIEERNSSYFLVGRDLADGSVLWSKTWGSEITAMVASGDRLIVAVGNTIRCLRGTQ